MPHVGEGIPIITAKGVNNGRIELDRANVLFFDRKPAADKQAWTTALWIYDFRTNLHFTL